MRPCLPLRCREALVQVVDYFVVEAEALALTPELGGGDVLSLASR